MYTVSLYNGALVAKFRSMGEAVRKMRSLAAGGWHGAICAPDGMLTLF